MQYEDDFYSESKKKFPDFGSIVMTNNGPARVLSINIFSESLKVILEDKQTVLTYLLEEVTIGK